jgi:hypothetical protein
MVHLKTLSSLGHRTSEPHVMQFPVAKSLLPVAAPCLDPFTCVFPLGLIIWPPPLAESESEPPVPALFCRFFFVEKRDGKGWLMDRP